MEGSAEDSGKRSYFIGMGAGAALAIIILLAAEVVYPYLFPSYNTRFRNTLTQCVENAQVYCNSWKSAGYAYDINGNPDLGGPSAKNLPYSEIYPECSSTGQHFGFDMGNDLEACRQFIGDIVTQDVPSP
jgi:hypothetical protein